MCYSRVLLLCCFLYVISSAHFLYASDEALSKINLTLVATVDGIPIYQHMIDVHPASIEAFSTEGSFKKEDIETYATKRKLDKLSGRIRQIIEERAIQNFGIKVTEEEVRREVDSRFRQAGINDSQAHKIVEIHNALVIGLEKWHKDKTQGAKIYEENLVGLITQPQWHQWHQWQKSCPSSKELAKIKSLVPKGLDDMKVNSFKSSKQDLLRSKLIVHVTGSVRVGEDEIRLLYAKRYPSDLGKPEFSAAEKNLREEVFEKKKNQVLEEWWRASVQQANVQIKDKKIKTLWEKRNRSVLLAIPQAPIICSRHEEN